MTAGTGQPLHPSQFQVDEAWLVFRLNDVPIQTERDGDFHVIVLMDAASGFILANTFAPIEAPEPPRIAVRELLDQAKSHNGRLPTTLLVPHGQFTRILPDEAGRQGIAVVRVPEDQLQVFIGDARRAFKEHFGGSSLQ